MTPLVPSLPPPPPPASIVSIIRMAEGELGDELMGEIAELLGAPDEEEAEATVVDPATAVAKCRNRRMEQATAERVAADDDDADDEDELLPTTFVDVAAFDFFSCFCF